MISMEEVEQLKPFEARSIIEELRKGSVPMEYVPVFTVGRKNWLTFIEDDLEKLSPTLTDGSEEDCLKKRQALTETFQNIPGMDINFANALAALVNNHFAPLADEEEDRRTDDHEVLLHWFEGGKVTKRELKPFLIYEFLNKANSRQFMNSLILFLRHIGHQGLILLMDEMETVVAQSASIRNAAYENVRLFIDNSESAQYLHIFFSIIPDVLVSEKGFKSYDALWSRIRSIGEAGKLNYRGVLVDIHQTPLKTSELVELGRCLRALHGISYRWDPRELVTDDVLERICSSQKRMGVISEVRLFIKQLIHLLDMAEQGHSPQHGPFPPEEKIQKACPV